MNPAETAVVIQSMALMYGTPSPRKLPRDKEQEALKKAKKEKLRAKKKVERQARRKNRKR